MFQRRMNWPVHTVTTTPVCVEAVTRPAVALIAPGVIGAVLLTARAACLTFIKVCKRQMGPVNSHHVAMAKRVKVLKLRWDKSGGEIGDIYSLKLSIF